MIEWITKAVTTNGSYFKIIYLMAALEIMLLPGHNEGLKGELPVLRQVLLRQGISYVPEAILHLYEKRSHIIHGGTLGITSYSAYWTWWIC